MPTINRASYFPRRANLRVNNLAYAADVDAMNGQCRAELGILPAAGTNGIMNAVPLDAIVTKGGTVLAAFDPDKSMGLYGRNVVVTLSASGTQNVTVRGRDYLGQPMNELIAIAAGTTGTGKKAFKSIDNISTSAAAAGATASLGWGNVLGLPYAITKVTDEFVDDAVPAAGTIVLASTAAQTATTADPRGSYTPAAGVVPNGARNITLIGFALMGQLHGVPHYYA